MIIDMLVFFRHPASRDGSPGNPNQTVMIIGNNNVFEVGSCILCNDIWVCKLNDYSAPLPQPFHYV